jgi:phage terminase large subunit GpA-like protein
MESLKRHEGYMFIDNRNSPGIDDETMIKFGYPVGAGKGVYESATYTCSHCNAIVIIEPKRTRERGFCLGCGQRICDACNLIRAQTMECRTMKQIIEELQELDVKQDNSTILLNKEI